MNDFGSYDSTNAWRAYRTDIKSVVIGSGVTSIGEWAFYYCSSLPSVTIPGSVTSIGRSAFYSCSSLTSVTIPNSVTSIGEYAFRGCSSLTSVTIPNSVTSIGNYAFYNCSSLRDVYYTGTQAQWNAITIGSNNDPLTSATLHLIVRSGTLGRLDWTLDADGTLTITGSGVMNAFTSSSTNAWRSSLNDIKSVVVGPGVTSIGNDAFYQCRNVTSVTLPDGLTAIGAHAFDACTKLPSVTLPDSVTAIGDSAFFCCFALTGIVIPAGVTSIDSATFYACRALASVTIPNGVTGIGSSAFKGCALTEVSIPNSVKKIESYAFHECDSLRDVYYVGTQAQWDAINIGNYNDPLRNAALHLNSVLASGTWGSLQWTLEVDGKLTITGSGAMDDFDEDAADAWRAWPDDIKTVVLEPGVTSIGVNAFRELDGFSDVSIPDSVTAIGLCAFYRCGSLTSVAVSESVTSIGGNAFCDCGSLTGIQVSERNANYCSVDGVLFDKGMKTLLQYPAGKSGSSYTIPDGVTTIGNSAFDSCTGLASVTIPNSVTEIGNAAFSGCTGLTDVYFRGTKARWDAITIGTLNDPLRSATLHVEPSDLAAPALVSATAGSGGIVFKWNAVNGAAKYRVYRKYTGVNWTVLGDVAGTSYTDRNVTAGTTYTYTARCVNAAGQTVSGFDANGKSATAQYAAPALISATASGSGIVFKWSAVNGVTKYRVYRKYAGVNWTALANVTGTSYTDTAVTAGTTYTYTARCLDASGNPCSGFDANGKSATAAAAQLAAPTLVSATASGSSIVFKWNAVAGASKYRVYRKYAGVNWTALGDTAATSYTDTNVAAGTTYTYTARCVNAAGQTVSGFDATGKSARIGGTLPAPRMLSALPAGGNTVAVHWYAVEGAAKYRVFRRTGNDDWTKVADVIAYAGDNTASYTDIVPGPGTYRYTVCCLSADGSTCTSEYDDAGVVVTVESGGGGAGEPEQPIE